MLRRLIRAGSIRNRDDRGSEVDQAVFGEIVANSFVSRIGTCASERRVTGSEQGQRRPLAFAEKRRLNAQCVADEKDTASVFRQRQKFATSGKVLFEGPQQAGCNHRALLFAHSTATHALVFPFDHHVRRANEVSDDPFKRADGEPLAALMVGKRLPLIVDISG